MRHEFIEDELDALWGVADVMKLLAHFNQYKLARVEPRIGMGSDFDWQIDGETLRLQSRIAMFNRRTQVIANDAARRELERG